MDITTYNRLITEIEKFKLQISDKIKSMEAEIEQLRHDVNDINNSVYINSRNKTVKK